MSKNEDLSQSFGRLALESPKDRTYVSRPGMVPGASSSNISSARRPPTGLSHGDFNATPGKDGKKVESPRESRLGPADFKEDLKKLEFSDDTQETKLLREHFAATIPTRTRFLIGDILGTGTFGRVCLATYSFQKTRYFALKILRKATVVRLKQVEHIRNEKLVLEQVNHPFIVNLYATFKDERHLYMVMDYVPGGELFTLLRRSGRFSHRIARFYAAEIVLAFEHLHSMDFVYRDLKPENLLINKDGHIKITDFGFSKHVPDNRTYTVCGTPEYLAPEIIRSKGHGKPVDWWALGILIFEMLAGFSPFYGESTQDTYEKILEGRFTWPRHFDNTDIDLISRLATADLTRRLGCLSGGVEDIKRHPWFALIDWGQLYRKQVKAPFTPKLRTPWDTTNFPRYPEEPTRDFRPLTQEEQDYFADF